MSAGRGIVLACPIFTSGKRLRRRICLLVFFVFIRDIRGSRTSGQGGIWAALERGGVWEWFVPSVEEFGSSRRLTLQGTSTLPRGACSGDSMSAGRGIVLACPIFTSGKRLRRRICLLVFFVFIRDIRGSRTSRQGGIWAALERGGVCEWFVPSVEEFGSCGTITLQGFSFGSVAEILDGSTEDQEDSS